MQQVRVRTGIWYNDRSVTLSFPDHWDVKTYWPSTPPPLTDEEIIGIIKHPVGQAPLGELARGKKNPFIIIDDLSRPTPVFKIIHFLLEEFDSAGFSMGDVSILVATGTHGAQNEKALEKKIGRAAMNTCRVIVHNDRKGTKYIGKTSFNTPVYINKELLKADCIIGIGGVYPQHTTGFGGGSKLALGVSGRRTITHLHYSHKSMGGAYDIDNDFRKDVSEIAHMIGLNTMFTLHVDAQLELVNMMAGDHHHYYAQAADFSRVKYAAPIPGDCDVVISNAYPFDTSYTFMRKAYRPLDLAPPDVAKVIVASNHEGIGAHGLFQHMSPPRLIKYKTLVREMSTMEFKVIISKVLKRLTLRREPKSNAPARNYALPGNTKHLWLYRPIDGDVSVQKIEGISVLSSWSDIVENLTQGSFQERLRVKVYPCAGLQCLVSPANKTRD